MSEKHLQSAIIEALNYSGLCFVWNVNAGKIRVGEGRHTRMIQMAPAGHSDIQGVSKKGRFIALEVKLPERVKTVTQKQQDFLDIVSDFGGITGVVTSPEQALQTVKEAV